MKTNKHGIAIMNREELDQFYSKWELSKSTKPILLMGPCGVGKTEFFRRKGKQIITANDIVGRYMQHGMKGIVVESSKGLTPSFGNHYNCIDDIGTEVEANHYGSKMDVLSFIIQASYSTRQYYHYTTNLNYDELESKYGPRVMDRLKEMCYFIIIEDTSFRKLKTIEDIQSIMDYKLPEIQPKTEEENLEFWN